MENKYYSLLRPVGIGTYPKEGMLRLRTMIAENTYKVLTTKRGEKSGTIENFQKKKFTTTI